MATKRTKKPSAVARHDGWVNLLTNLGRRGADPHASTTFNASALLAVTSGMEQVFEDLYRGDGNARKIVELPAREMTREGFEIEGDPDGEIVAALQEIDGPNKIREWLRWARLHGGSILVPTTEEASSPRDPTQPLADPINLAVLRRVTGFHCWTRWRVTINDADLYKDPAKPNFETPEWYTVNPATGGSLRIHESRVLRVDGASVSDETRRHNGGWGDSVLTSCWAQLKNVGASDSYSVAVIRDFVQGVMTIQNLANLIASGQESKIITRLNIIDLTRSILNTMILDKDETYTKVTSSVAGLPDIMDRHREALAAAAEMPMTLLFGRPPGGLSTDDQSGMRNWYDRIAGEQESLLQPSLEKLVRLMQAAKDGPTNGREIENWAIKFKPLFQLTKKEEAEVRKTNMETDKGYVESGVLTAQEVRDSRWGSGRYGDEITIDKSLDVVEEADEEEGDEEPAPVNGNGAAGA